MKHCSIILLISLVLLSCNKDLEPLTDAWRKYDYFPLAIGKEWIYQVDSTIYDPVPGEIQITKTSNQLREVIRDTFMDQTGQLNFILDRYERQTEADNWTLSGVWHMLKNTDEAQRVEHNLRFVKLIFPPKEGASWDGNRYFDPQHMVVVAGEPIEIFKNWKYTILESGVSRMIGSQSFDQIVTVVQSDDENVIEKRFSQEQYAFGVGLVSKEQIILDTQNTNQSLAWEEKAEKGFILKQTLISSK